MTLGERIKHYRGLKDLPLNRLAILSDVSPAYISTLENNKSDSPSVEIVKKIANALNISVLDLLSDTESEQACENCRFYNGECRRYPPQLDQVKYYDGCYDESYWYFPNVDKTDWCGEWQPKT